jgi:hypothetical protein
MKKLSLIIISILFVLPFAKAQFGYKKMAEIETFKDTRLIVVLFADSAYNASIKAAVGRFWNFNGGFEFVQDSMMKQYNKPEFSFLTFARSKKSPKIKAKLCSSDDDFNGLIVTSKYKKRSKVDEMIASAYCSNVIDTADWYPELVRAVQMLNNYFNFAIQASTDKDIDANNMIHNYPADLTILSGKKLIYEDRMLEMKGKEDASQIFGAEVEEVGKKDIYNAVLTQDPDVIYVFNVMNEKFCDKIFVSAAGSEVMHISSGPNTKCKIDAKDLKSFKVRIDKANKE